MFGRSERRTPLTREQSKALEDLRDDCIALFINSGLTQKKVHELGGPTPGTISKWLYKETFFPRWTTIDSFLRALGFGLMPVHVDEIGEWRKTKVSERLDLSVSFAGRPKMAPKRKVGAQ